MQYTATAFAQPLTEVFRGALALRETGARPDGYFPAAAARDVQAEDPVERALYEPVLSWSAARLLSLRQRHGARVQQYLLYVFFAVIALLIYSSRLLRP